MKYLSKRYAKVMTYKGIDICALKVAIPSQGDELGYRIDDPHFEDKFGNIDEAVEAIDAIMKINRMYEG